MFKELDRNHDGHISKAEAKRSADVSARFSAIDTDKNKQISLHEWQADEKNHARGAAGVSGASREPSSQTTTPAKPEMNKSGY
ncbi:MAG TPA: EF-hand domain-containing protein [Azonexus sp.]|nr:EF-hand domain-containing protein [Azonexus sp.]